MNEMKHARSTVTSLSIVIILTACAPSTESRLRLSMAKYNPAHIELHPAFNDYVRNTSLPDGTQTGIITLADGDSARFWFLSHHGARDIGGTLFKFSNGAELYMSGYFCCELQLPAKQLASLTELRAFINSCDGTPP